MQYKVIELVADEEGDKDKSQLDRIPENAEIWSILLHWNSVLTQPVRCYDMRHIPRQDKAIWRDFTQVEPKRSALAKEIFIVRTMLRFARGHLIHKIPLLIPSSRLDERACIAPAKLTWFDVVRCDLVTYGSKYPNLIKTGD